MNSLIEKYNVPGPRYTSYPTVPFWSGIATESWLDALRTKLETDASPDVACYVHLPFCESLCTFCGCHKIITKNHDVEDPYGNAVVKEWGLYRSVFNKRLHIKDLHLGGGTPTFYSPTRLAKLVDGILSESDVSSDAAFGFEAHPNTTVRAHLEELKKLNFSRVSFGVQDFDKRVQGAINRRQSYSQVKRVTDDARDLGYSSVNYDLIYGLPHQTLSTMSETLAQVETLKPDRIAFYSYAHVPWLKPSQQRFTEKDLPDAVQKRLLYELGRQFFLEHGYVEIGMDHFALPTDELTLAMNEKKLHRNFMGYTTQKTSTMIGIGLSSISDSWTAFAQNTKSIDEYYQSIFSNKIPISHGHLLAKEDLIIRQHILNLMCFFETDWHDESKRTKFLTENLGKLDELQRDGIVQFTEFGLKISPGCAAFVRNVCMVFDRFLWSKNDQTRIFSKTI